jgi:hypothetical protein
MVSIKKLKQFDYLEDGTRISTDLHGFARL